MLLGCCHCDTYTPPPSESIPSESIPSESVPPPSNSVSESSSIETVTCFCVFPRRWVFTLPGPNRVGASPCCTAYSGLRTLKYVSCVSGIQGVWETDERASTTVTGVTCNSASVNPMFRLRITKGLFNTTIVLSSNPGQINFTYSVPNASFNCLSPFTLEVTSAVGGGGASCWGTPSSYLIPFSPG